MTEELKVVLHRSEHSGFGFSLLGTTGPPHVIYDIVENSPAADCGEVEAGDVILKVNGTDVHRYTTKEVLKCLRLSDDLVTLELKRDPKLKARIKEQLAKTKSPHYVEIEASPHIYGYYNCDDSNVDSRQLSAPPTYQIRTINRPSAVSNVTTTTASILYKSPTHLPYSKVKQAEQEQANESGVGGSVAIISTSPTNRPSRIPTALKSAQKSNLQSPQHKRSRPSQIPTKASTISSVSTHPSNGSEAFMIPATETTQKLSTTMTMKGKQNHLQHSHSYSGQGLENQQSQSYEIKTNSAPPEVIKAPRFEAYMMTGDLILNLSRTPQTDNILTSHTNRIDSLRDIPKRSITTGRQKVFVDNALAPKASGESSPTSSSSIDSPKHVILRDSIQQPNNQKQGQVPQLSNNNSIYNNSAITTNNTLLLCEELERDEDVDSVKRTSRKANNNLQKKYQQSENHTLQKTRGGPQTHHPHNYNDPYINNEDDDINDINYDVGIEEDEEDQTHYDIPNMESDLQCLESSSGSGRSGNAADNDVEDYDNVTDENLLTENKAISTKKKLLALKKKKNMRHRRGMGLNAQTDSVDCASQQHSVGSMLSSSSNTIRSDNHNSNTSQDESSFSVPTSPTSSGAPLLLDKEISNSLPTSPEPSSITAGTGIPPLGAGIVVRRHNGIVRKCDSAGFRTSKSEDHLQQIQREGMAALIPIDIDEDVNSSLNTLLNTRTDSEDSQTSTSSRKTVLNKQFKKSIKTRTQQCNVSVSTRKLTKNNVTEGVSNQYNISNNRRRRARICVQNIDKKCEGDTESNESYVPLRSNKTSNLERIVWTYNAPLKPHQLEQLQQRNQQDDDGTELSNNSSKSSSHSPRSSSLSSSLRNSAEIPASPTSVSSSVMSSSGSKSGILGAGGIEENTKNYATVLINGKPQLKDQQIIENTTATNSGTGLLQNTIKSSGGSNCSIVAIDGGVGCSVMSCSGDQSISEAISNISSPDYQDDNLLSSRDLLGNMALSDPSDSDSTIIVSDTASKQQPKNSQQQEHKLVIRVKGVEHITNTKDNTGNNHQHISPLRNICGPNLNEFKDSEDELITISEDQAQNDFCVSGVSGNYGRDSSPPVSDDGSDVESLHSYHYSPKAVDMPSAIRLAKRLYLLDGFKKSDVSRHLSKNNDFSRAVADEYLKYFDFTGKTLDQSLREFLKAFSLSGETQERERVLVHFSKRFLECNPENFNSQDAVHTLTCAIMLLNTDLHGPNIGRKMTCPEFIENLAELNDGENFPKDILKYLYHAIKTQPLEWAFDDDDDEKQRQPPHQRRPESNSIGNINNDSNNQLGQNPFLDLPESKSAVEYKKGYMMRKCCYDANYKKTPFGKRSWKMFYCTLRDLVLYLHKDEHGFRKSQMSDNLHNAIRIHHSLVTKATDYTKKQHVFRLQTADQAEYLFQTSDSKELESWIETINFVCAAYSAPPLEAGVGSQKRFQRPLLPCTHTKLLMKEQLDLHDNQLAKLEIMLTDHKKTPVPSKGLPLQNYKEKENYLLFELHRFKTYATILRTKSSAEQQLSQSSPNSEQSDAFPANLLKENLPSTNSIMTNQQQSNETTSQQTIFPTITNSSKSRK